MSQSHTFPLASCPRDVAPDLRPWAAQFVGLDPDAVAKQLAERWMDVRSGLLGRLADHIISFAPSALVCHEGKVWIELGQMTENGFEGYFVPPPPSEESVSQVFSKYKFRGTVRRQIGTFLRHFSGLQEEPPPSAGYFAEEPWYTLSDIMYFPDLDFGSFDSAFPLYHGLSGDLLLVNSDGRTAWWLFAEGRGVEFLDSFEDFIMFYVSFRAATDEQREGLRMALDPYAALAFVGRPIWD